MDGRSTPIKRDSAHFDTSATEPGTRPVYTVEQVLEIYDRIRLPQEWRYKPGSESQAVVRGSDAVEFLNVIHRSCITSIPFENLELHYSVEKNIDISPEGLFEKIVSQGSGRGGFCMENTAFLATLLRSLGFQVMCSGGRVNTRYQPSGEISTVDAYKGWGHMVAVVTIHGDRYAVDAGFGSGCPLQPLRMRDGEEVVNKIAGQTVRLRWGAIPENENPDAKMWIYERRFATDTPWISLYCFPDNVEFLPGDFAVMNFATTKMPTSFFTYRLMCVKFLLDERGQEIVGDVVLFDQKLHRRFHGRKEVFGLLETEDARIKALEEHFDVRLSPEQQGGIRGMPTALPLSV